MYRPLGKLYGYAKIILTESLALWNLKYYPYFKKPEIDMFFFWNYCDRLTFWSRIWTFGVLFCY